jgi:transcriptional regulator with XRE-family HTH domain
MARKHELIDKLDKFIGEKLYLTRISQGFTRQKLALEIGVSHQQIQKYEKGTNRISAGRLLLISCILKKPISFFYEGFNEEFISEIESNTSNRLCLEFSKNFIKLNNPNHQSAVNNLIKSLIKESA